MSPSSPPSRRCISNSSARWPRSPTPRRRSSRPRPRRRRRSSTATIRNSAISRAAPRKPASRRIVAFGEHAKSDARLIKYALHPECSTVAAQTFSAPKLPTRSARRAGIWCRIRSRCSRRPQWSAPISLWRRWRSRNSAPSPDAARVITIELPGGTALVIDESYNANPASVAAALALLGQAPVGAHGRRIAVLGDMLELGPRGRALHRGLSAAVEANAIDLVFCCRAADARAVAGSSRRPPRRLCRERGGARAASRVRDPRRRRRHGEGFARLANGAHRQGAARQLAARRDSSKPRPHKVDAMFYWLVESFRQDLVPQRLPLHHVPHRRRRSSPPCCSCSCSAAHHRPAAFAQGKGQPIRTDGPNRIWSTRPARRPWAG